MSNLFTHDLVLYGKMLVANRFIPLSLIDTEGRLLLAGDGIKISKETRKIGK